MINLQHWGTLWTSGQAGWHLEDVNQILLKYSTKLGLTTPKRVFVPLCGKSEDVLWFYKTGHEVVGVEAVESPVKQFFEANNLQYNVQEFPTLKLYQTDDGLLKIYNCNIFDLNADELGKFNVFWDRGSLVAIEIEERERYAALMKELFGPSFEYLLVTFQYDGEDIEGATPRCIPHELIEELFGEACMISLLEKNDVTSDTEKNSSGLEELWESVHFLSPK